MARVSEKNPRFRTKEQICHDLAEVLKADLSYGTKYAVVSEITWVWSEYNGKHRGCQYWSEKAIDFHGPLNKLIHEHIVPKKVLIDKLFNEIVKEPLHIFNFLSRFCIGVLVTKDEDLKLNKIGLQYKMPESWDHKDPWARYKMAGISVLDKTNK